MPKDFLADHHHRHVPLDGADLSSSALILGQGAQALEVVVADSSRRPTQQTLRRAWAARSGGRAAPLMLVVLHDGHAALCGPAGTDPPVYLDVDPGQAERICQQALEQPDRHAALRMLRDALPSVQTEHPGVRNEGFLATHELLEGARQLESWPEALSKSQGLMGQRGEPLLRALGYDIQRLDNVTSVLSTQRAGRKVAVAVLLRQDEAPELKSDRFGGLSAVSYALNRAGRENVPYVLLSQGPKLRLYPARTGVGVGQRGRTETYIELHAGLLREVDAGYLWTLLSADALDEGGTLDHLLENSGRYAGKLASDLRERIYTMVVPVLAQGVAHARGIGDPSAHQLADTYEMTMTILFRILFIAYAEDKDLLPYRWNEPYRQRSVKAKAAELRRLVHEAGGDDIAWDAGDDHWHELRRLFHAVEKGHTEWGVPEYDGGLFTSDPGESANGAIIDGLSIPNSVMGPALRDLLLIGTPEGVGPVDFRSLGVREFGTIYEGLLESELAVAETDLAVDAEGKYRPAGEDDEVVVHQSHVYLHNRSGARKSSGTYFTKHFAVEHLLDTALEPALDDHLARLDAIDDADAADAFFDFRVADIAMGSGHFLVAAIDRIEKRLADYFTQRPLGRVKEELNDLREAALAELDRHGLKDTLADEIEDGALLRRLVARRCVYGVDMNPVAVDLASLSLWIHTFVPGLPLSLLDHTLVCGNSLVGIGRVEELKEIANPDDSKGGSLFGLDLEQLVGAAMEPLRRLANAADATVREVRKTRQSLDRARAESAPAAALCDIATDCRMRGEVLPVDLGDWATVKDRLPSSRAHKDATGRLAPLEPLHFPIAFPEVFLRERAGFDVILGNPPWEEATVEEDAFWGRHQPRLRGLPQRDQERIKEALRTVRPDLVAMWEQERSQAEALRAALVTGPYPGMGTGDPDLYKAFCWRFVHLLTTSQGRLGVVLPRSAMVAKGSTDFRLTLLNSSDPFSVTMLRNTGGWVFDEAERRYTIGLIGICRRKPSGKSVQLRGPFPSLTRFQAGIARAPATFSPHEVAGWTDTASLPQLPTEESLDVFVRLRRAPRLDTGDNWLARPYRELDATNDKRLMDLESAECPDGYWPVYKGKSLEVWEPDTGVYYAWADPQPMMDHLLAKRRRACRTKSSPWRDFAEQGDKWLDDPHTLPCNFPRIAFRDVGRSDDSRTMRTALVPPRVFIANTAPFFLWPRGDERDEAYLLGVLSSLPLDWYARRFVETHLNFHVLNPFPIPRPDRADPGWTRVVELAGRLAAPDDRFADWAEAVGVDCGPLEAEARWEAICELDAVVAHLYGLEERHLRHVFETFHESWEPGATSKHPTLGPYDERVERTIEHFRRHAG